MYIYIYIYNIHRCIWSVGGTEKLDLEDGLDVRLLLHGPHLVHGVRFRVLGLGFGVRLQALERV